jgi:ribosomal protein S18 acetylase RimI-like enzyme
MPSPGLIDVEIREHGDELIESLRPLYIELHLHQARGHPRVFGCPARSPDDAWQRRSAHYQNWLAQPDAAILAAFRAETLVGYALTTTAPGYDGWDTQDRVGEIKDLVIQVSERRSGLGSALMDRAKRHFRDRGIAGLRLNVMEGNNDALGLYKRLGMTPTAVTMTCTTDS